MLGLANEKTSRTALETALYSPTQYHADVCFLLPSKKVYAHRAIIADPLKDLFPTLMDSSNEGSMLYINVPSKIADDEISNLLVICYRVKKPDEVQLKECLRKKPCEIVPLNAMKFHDFTFVDGTRLLKCHIFLLASYSPYFKAILLNAKGNAREVDKSKFPGNSFQLLLDFIYTDTIVFSEDDDDERKKIQTLCHLYQSAKSAQMIESLGQRSLLAIMEICHDFKCYCSECAKLLPSVLNFVRQHRSTSPSISILRCNLVNLYSTEDAIKIFWVQDAFNHLVDVLQQDEIIIDIFQKTEENIKPGTAISYLTEFYRIKNRIVMNFVLVPALKRVADNIKDLTNPESDLGKYVADPKSANMPIDLPVFILDKVVEYGASKNNVCLLYECICDLITLDSKTGVLNSTLIDARKACAKKVQAFSNDPPDTEKLEEIQKIMIKNGDIRDEVPGFLDPWKRLLVWGSKSRRTGSFSRSKSRKGSSDMKPLSRSQSLTTDTAFSGYIDTLEPDTNQSSGTAMIPRTSSSTSLTSNLLYLNDNQKPTQSNLSSRKTTITFELPVIPPRPAFQRRSSQHANRKRSQSPKPSLPKSKMVNVNVDDRVRLLYRPTAIYGTIKYISEDGSEVGIKLDESVGDSDGTDINGVRRFNTYPNRAKFVKASDVEVIQKK